MEGRRRLEMRTVGYVRPSNKSVGESNAYRLRTSCDGERN